MKVAKQHRTFLLLSLMISILSRSIEAATVVYQLREEQANGTFVGNVERQMLIQKELQPQDAVNLKYTLSASGNTKNSLFIINETSSSITTFQRIDRETVCPGQTDCSIKLNIAVYKRGEGAALDLFKLWYAVINIVDMNDNAPTFPQRHVSLSVPESVPVGHVLRTSAAEDRDKGEKNSVQVYTLSPPNPLFGLKVIANPDGSSDLGIVIQGQLDREVQELYQLKVVATDGGYPQKTGSLALNITVADVNDNRPTFVRSSYNGTVKENVRADTPILTVSATDFDSGVNGDVAYSFNARVADEVKTRFAIDPTSGVISAIGAIDFEEKQQYQFLVEARDKGSPQLSGASMVILNVEDVNDNAPQININLTPGGNNLTEDEAVGKFIAHVSVSDRDSGSNSVVICSMEDDHFMLQKFYDHAYNMYKVLLEHALDYESAPSHRVSITCRDTGQPQLTNTTAFTVHVRDVNDLAPRFSRETYTASIIENQLDVQDLLQVSAVDYDTGPGGEVEYALDRSTPNVTRLFNLHPYTGWLQARAPLNREHYGQFAFRVLAFDHGIPSLTSSVSVIISVQDQNDEKPYFTRPLFDCYVLERQPIATRVGSVSAVDADSVQHSRMVFTIVPGVGDYLFFSIDNVTGVIQSQAVFDREQKSMYRFKVKVEDPQVPPFYDLANVTVQVLDDNDNPPVIHYPREGNNSVNVSYAVRVGSVLAVVHATDDDEGKYGRLSYSITAGNPSRLFDLNQHDGSLRLARNILPADVKEHVLRIEVKDGGNPPSFRDTELHVNVVVGNMTLLESRGGRKDDNIIIVVVLVCVTVVLALAVVITICLIRRIDREKRAKRRAAAFKAEEEKMFHLKTQDSFRNASPPSSSAGGNSASSNASNGRISKKKEVSFSIDEGVSSLNSSSGSSCPMTTFRNSSDKHKDLRGTENGSPSVPCPPPRGASISDSSIHNPLAHRLAATDEPHHHLRPVQEEEGSQYMEMMKRSGEDALSESSGETGTSDSGRGGSEDDSHSNRGSAMIDQALQLTECCDDPVSQCLASQHYI